MDSIPIKKHNAPRHNLVAYEGIKDMSNKSIQTLIEIFTKSNAPEAEFLHFMKAHEIEHKLSHQSLFSKAQAVAKKIMTLSKGENILLDGDNSIEFLINFFVL